VLSLFGNMLGHDGGVAIGDALGKGALPELRQLGLGYNDLGDSGGSAVGRGLCLAPLSGSPWMLEKIDLAHNGLGQESAKALFAVIEAGFMPALTDIYLQNSIFDAESKRRLREAQAGPGCSFKIIYD